MDAAARRTVIDDARSVVRDSGFETLRSSFGQDRLLRLVIDHPKRKVTMEDATRMNLRIRAALRARGQDVDDFRIEIESPGADRPLTEPKHFERFRGERVRVVRRGGEASRRVVVGILKSTDASGFVIAVEGGADESFRYSETAEARLDPALPF